MKYLLSTIADVDYREEGVSGKMVFVKRTAPVAIRYGLGLELAEFCISENLDENFEEVLPHFEYNRNAVSDVVLHAPYNDLYPHAIDSLVVKAAWDRYDWTWKLCKRYNIDKIVVHANYVECLFYPEWFIEKQIAFWRHFLDEHDDNITLCIENVMEKTPSMITDIVKGVGDERFKMCLDIGHANLTGVSPETWLRECAPFISHYHIHNNNGPAAGDRPSLGDRHAALGNGIMDMKHLLTLAEELTPLATASVESAFLEESAEWLKDNFPTRGRWCG